MMRRLLSIISLCAVALCGLSCHGTIDPNEGGGNTDLPEGVDTTINLASGYAKKQIAMQFTSVGCVNCPFLADAIKDVQANRPGEIIPVAFHLDYGGYADPMSLPMNSKFYEKVATGDGLPMFALNFTKSSQHIINEYAKIVSEIDHQAEKYPAVCGVAISTKHEAGSVEVTAKFKSDVAGIYRYHIFLVEDGYEYYQQGADSDTYVHNNVLRAIVSDNVMGSKLDAGNYLEPGREYEVVKTIEISQDWNVENMRVVVAMLNTKDGGKSFIANNAAECAVGKSVDYAFAGDAPMVESRFKRHVCVMEFTGSWCAQCPSGATTLNYLVDKAYKGRAFAMAFHNNTQGADIYALPQEQELWKIFKYEGYPAYVTDMDESKVGLLNDGGCSSTIESSLYDSMTHCGAALACTYDQASRTVSVDARMFSELTMNYRIAAYVVEDKVVGEQKQSTGELQDNYTHRHLVRQMLSSSVRGDALSQVAAETEAGKKYTFTVADDWNIENLSVAVLILDDKGHVNNMATCAADGGSMDYEYIN